MIRNRKFVSSFRQPQKAGQAIEKIREFVRMKIQDGRFVNVVNSIIVTIVWNAKEDTNGFDKYKR